MADQDPLWTQAYLKLKEQWRLEPNWKLIEYLHLIPQGPVLDLGAGNGRNALFFAELGHARASRDLKVSEFVLYTPVTLDLSLMKMVYSDIVKPLKKSAEDYLL